MQTTVSPTFWEAWHYANLSGQGLWTAIGIICLFGAIAVALMIKGNVIMQSSGTVFIMVVLALGSLGCFFGKVLPLWLNNDKVVQTEYLQKVGRKYILDSVYYDNRMQNAAVKK